MIPTSFSDMPRSLVYVQRLMGPLLHPVTHLLTDNKTDNVYHIIGPVRCSVFSTPKPDMIISDPVSFFTCQSIPIGAECKLPI